MNRSRPNQIKIRLSDEELSILKSKVQQSGKTQQEFFISLINNSTIVNLEELNPIYVELKRQGNNQNQIARVLNQLKYDKQILEENLIDVIKENQRELDKLWQSLNQYLRKHR